MAYVRKQSQVTSTLYSLSYTTLELQGSTSDTTRKDRTMLVQEFLQEFRIRIIDILDAVLCETAISSSSQGLLKTE